MRLNKRIGRGFLVIGLFLAVGAIAQDADSQASDPPVFRIDASFVWVPTVVKSETGATVRNLTAEQFKLWDDDIEQSIVPVRTDDLPVSLMILMQTGGSAGRYFASYADLPSLLGRLASGAIHEISLVTFDSRIEQIWHFPDRSDGVEHALTHQHGGDSGAAIRDATEFGVRQLQAEPGRFRRIVLLLSDAKDEGSEISSERIVEQLGTASTVIYSLAFPSSSGAGKKRSARSGVIRGDKGSNGLDRAISNMNSETSKELAMLSGGISVRFNDRPSFNSGLLEIAAHIRDGYTLGFQPNHRTPGFHRIRVGLDRPNLTVIARTAYWSQPVNQLNPSEKP